MPKESEPLSFDEARLEAKGFENVFEGGPPGTREEYQALSDDADMRRARKKKEAEDEIKIESVRKIEKEAGMSRTQIIRKYLLESPLEELTHEKVWAKVRELFPTDLEFRLREIIEYEALNAGQNKDHARCKKLLEIIGVKFK